MQTSKKKRVVEQAIVYDPALSGNSGDPFNIDLMELFYRLIERAKYIALSALLGTLVAAVVTFLFIQPIYTATSKIYVMSSSDAAINLSDLQMGTYLASDYKEVFLNWHVHERVLQTLDLPYSYEELSDMLTVTNPTDTRILYINVDSPDPHEAKRIADTYATVAKEFIAATMDTKEPSLFEEALLPSSPSHPKTMVNLAFGFLVGMLLACAVIIVRFMADDKVRTASDVEKYLDLPVLGMLPVQTGKPVLLKKSRRDGVSV